MHRQKLPDIVAAVGPEHAVRRRQRMKQKLKASLYFPFEMI